MGQAARYSGYGSLERSIMQLNAIICDVCFDRDLSDTELVALQHVAIAKQELEKARREHALYYFKKETHKE